MNGRIVRESTTRVPAASSPLWCLCVLSTHSHTIGKAAAAAAVYTLNNLLVYTLVRQPPPPLSFPSFPFSFPFLTTAAAKFSSSSLLLLLLGFVKFIRSEDEDRKLKLALSAKWKQHFKGRKEREGGRRITTTVVLIKHSHTPGQVYILRPFSFPLLCPALRIVCLCCAFCRFCCCCWTVDIIFCSLYFIFRSEKNEGEKLVGNRERVCIMKIKQSVVVVIIFTAACLLLCLEWDKLKC